MSINYIVYFRNANKLKRSDIKTSRKKNMNNNRWSRFQSVKKKNLPQIEVTYLCSDVNKELSSNEVLQTNNKKIYNM